MIKVFFDGKCGLCSKEIAYYKRISPKGSFEWKDISESECADELINEGVTIEEGLKSLHAKDYVKGMWMMLQKNKPNDYVLASGKTHSVREFIEKAFAHVDINIKWIGEGEDEKGLNEENNEILVEVDREYFRPTEVDYLHGDPSFAMQDLKWRPEISFNNLIKEMIESDLELVKKEL